MDPEVVTTPTVSRRFQPLLIILALVVLLFSGLFFYFRSHRSQEFVPGLVSNPLDNLASTAGRTNLVFLGFGGEGHQAADLTDSMIFVSLSHLDSSITLLSIPRDIWVDTMVAKINTAYYYGNERREGGGLDLAKSAVSEITGQPVHYALALDFQGFVEAIDAIGGIDLEIKNSFDDYQYPIPGKEDAEPESERYEHLHFDAGPAHLDGELALKFARSRHAEGEEGTDFARSARQQQIITAFQDKLLSSETLLKLDVLKDLFSRFRDNIDTDITDGEFGSFFRFFLNYQAANRPGQSLSLDDYLTSPKDSTPYQKQWVLIPTSSWEEIHGYVQDSLN